MNFSSLFQASFAIIGFFYLANATLIASSGSSVPAISGQLAGLGRTSLTPSAVTSAIAEVGALAVAGALAASQLVDIRRKKRQTEACLPVNNPDIFFSLAATSDKLGCGMRLICELEQTTDDELSSEEKLILGLFGRSPQPVNKTELSTAKSGFQYAAFVGANAADISECKDTFNRCPFDRITMMKAFRDANEEGEIEP